MEEMVKVMTHSRVGKLRTARRFSSHCTRAEASPTWRSASLPGAGHLASCARAASTSTEACVRRTVGRFNQRRRKASYVAWRIASSRTLHQKHGESSAVFASMPSAGKCAPIARCTKLGSAPFLKRILGRMWCSKDWCAPIDVLHRCSGSPRPVRCMVMLAIRAVLKLIVRRTVSSLSRKRSPHTQDRTALL